MHRSIALLLSMLAAGCGKEDPGPAANDRQAGIVVQQPAGAAPTGLNDVIGATPGPCGSTRARSALGKRFTPDLAAKIKRLSGASAVNFIDFRDETPLEKEQDPRRLNVLLSEEDKVILLDCG